MEVEVLEALQALQGLLALLAQVHRAHQVQFSTQMEVTFVEIQTSSMTQTFLAQGN